MAVNYIFNKNNTNLLTVVTLAVKIKWFFNRNKLAICIIKKMVDIIPPIQPYYWRIIAGAIEVTPIGIVLIAA